MTTNLTFYAWWFGDIILFKSPSKNLHQKNITNMGMEIQWMQDVLGFVMKYYSFLPTIWFSEMLSYNINKE